MDTQQAFDLVIQHLWRQNRTSRRRWPGSEGCAYRGGDATKCAIGTLIPDDLYRDDMEGLSSQVLIDQHPEVAGIPALRALCRCSQRGASLIVAAADALTLLQCTSAAMDSSVAAYIARAQDDVGVTDDLLERVELVGLLEVDRADARVHERLQAVDAG